MKPEVAGIALVAVVILIGTWFAFGLQPDSRIGAPPGYEVDGCYVDVCPADPSDRDAVFVRDTYGVEQLTNDTGAELGIQVEGNLAAWLVIRNTQRDVPASDIMAMNLTSKRLIPVGVGLQFHQTSPFLAGGRIVFAEERNSAHEKGASRAYLVLWEAGSAVPIETGLGGEAVPSAFDGTWVAFRQRGSPTPSNDGVWALDVVTGKTLLLHPATPAPTGDDFQPVVTGEVVTKGQAYLTITWENASAVRNATLVRIDLDSGMRAVVTSTDALGGSGQRWRASDAGNGSVVWHWSRGPDFTQIWLWNEASAKATAISTMRDGVAGLSRVAGDWVVYASDTGVVGWRTSTHEAVMLAPEDDGTIWTGAIDTDGERFLLAVFRQSNRFSTFFGDLYLGQMPE